MSNIRTVNLNHSRIHPNTHKKCHQNRSCRLGGVQWHTHAKKKYIHTHFCEGFETQKFKFYSSLTTATFSYWHHSFKWICQEITLYGRSACSMVYVTLRPRHQKTPRWVGNRACELDEKRMEVPEMKYSFL